MNIKKPPLAPAGGSVHKDKDLPDDLVRFSFRHFTPTEKFCYPDAADSVGYFQAFFERFKDISGLRISEFTKPGKTLRSHGHDWARSTEKSGYSHLSQQLQECAPWQLSLSANKHGRVHGILIDSTFYVVWLDPNHQLYPDKH